LREGNCQPVARADCGHGDAVSTGRPHQRARADRSSRSRTTPSSIGVAITPWKWSSTA
jgi:hypothetical protein